MPSHRSRKKLSWPKTSSPWSRRSIAALCAACGIGRCCSSAGGLRRSEIVGLDLKADQTDDGRGWIEILDKGLLITLRGKTGWREVEVGRGSSDATCPVASIETWVKFAKLAHGPLFRRVTGQGKAVGSERLNDKEQILSVWP